MKETKIKLWEKDKRKNAYELSFSEFNGEDRLFLNLPSKELKDVYNIARFIFQIEKFMFLDNKGKRRKNMFQITQIEIPLLSNLNNSKKEELSEILKQLFNFLYSQPIEFTFRKKEPEPKTSFQFPKKFLEGRDSILLFSGGLDSMIGLEYCQEHFDNPMLIYINQKPKLNPLINKIEKDLLEENQLLRISAPRMRVGYFANTSGFLYSLLASIFAYTNKCPIIIGECGVTTYQPKFGPLYDITHTTHPFVLQSVKRVMKILLNFDLEIKLPFNNYTKSEMIAKYGNMDKIKLSHSCLSSNPMIKGIKIPENCGKCYACLIRRLAIIPIFNDLTEYKHKEFLKKIEKKSIVPIVDFCYILLKDYDLLDYSQKEKIEKYQKKNLFERFSLDTLSTLYILSKEEKLPFNLKEYLNDFDRNLFNKRINELKNMQLNKRIKR